MQLDSSIRHRAAARPRRQQDHADLRGELKKLAGAPQDPLEPQYAATLIAAVQTLMIANT